MFDLDFGLDWRPMYASRSFLSGKLCSAVYCVDMFNSLFSGCHRPSLSCLRVSRLLVSRGEHASGISTPCMWHVPSIPFRHNVGSFDAEEQFNAPSSSIMRKSG